MNQTDTELHTVEQSLELLAREFALLLAASDLDEEIQDALISALPHLELEQIVNLVRKLETKYALSVTSDLDVALQEKLEIISTDFAERQAAREADLLSRLQSLSSSING